VTSFVIDALVPLCSVLLGALVTYWVNVRARRRSAAEDVVNAAIAAIAIAEAYGSNATYLDQPDWIPAAEVEALQRRLVLTAMEQHNVRGQEARAALARVLVFDTRVREHYLDPEAVFLRPAAIIALLTEIRDRVRTRRKTLGAS
jgi:hypothetical protein